jgi:hypothetical protein
MKLLNSIEALLGPSAIPPWEKWRDVDIGVYKPLARCNTHRLVCPCNAAHLLVGTPASRYLPSQGGGHARSRGPDGESSARRTREKKPTSAWSTSFRERRTLDARLQLPRLRVNNEAYTTGSRSILLEYSQPGIRLACFRPAAGTKYDRPMRVHHPAPCRHDEVYDPVTHPRVIRFASRSY